MNAEEVVKRVIEKYSSCESYCDRGELRTSVAGWGEISFETFYLAPKNLLVRITYGSSKDPIQTDTFWTNGSDFYAYSDGASTKCERIREDSNFYAFGMGWRFEFEVPPLLMLGVNKKFGMISNVEFELIDDHKHSEVFHLHCDLHLAPKAFLHQLDMEIDSTHFNIKKVKVMEKQNQDFVSDIANQLSIKPIRPNSPIITDPQKIALVGESSNIPLKLPMLFGKPGVFPMQEITTECIYHEIAFNKKIPPAFFEFRQSEK